MRMAIQSLGDHKHYSIDADWKDIAKVKNDMRDHNAAALLGVGDEIGRAALFGSAAKFEGRKVAAITMRPTTSVPYAQGKANVDWDRTEKHNTVPAVEVPVEQLTTIKASQPGIQHGALRHYLSQEQFGGPEKSKDVFAKNDGVSNNHPVFFENQDTGERVILSGHHRTTAALISGSPIRARVVRGYVK